jgi:small subunit ribosomal protein S2
MAAGEKDEFVELDAEGNPVTKESAGRDRDDRRRPAPRKQPAKRPAGRRGPPPPRGGAGAGRAEESPADAETPSPAE